MDEKEVQASSCMSISDELVTDGLYPMYFGVSCAFVALEILSGGDVNGDHRMSRTRAKMLKGSAHLLGLLAWRIQKGEAMERSLKSDQLLHKLKKAEVEIAELKKLRSEDAKANEKVVGIFATQEQNWFSERKNLRRQIGALMNELRVTDTKNKQVISDMKKTIEEKELLVESTVKDLKEEEGKIKELELKLQKAEAVMEEVRETAKKEAQEHSSELWKHKTALIELVSNQRQLEAEMGRALRQLEASKQELDSVLKQKDDSYMMIQKLSMEIVKTRKDLEQKDKILSAMLRKSKVDTAERQFLLKEVKSTKSRRKHADLETGKWRPQHDQSRHEMSSSRSNVPSHVDSRSNVYSWIKEVQNIEAGCSQNRKIRSNPKNLLLDYLEAEHGLEWGYIAPKKESKKSSKGSDQLSHEGSGELDLKQLEAWIQSEAEKITTMLEQKHHVEIEAFAEQLRLKDEKLEAFNWRLLSMELESKRLQSNIEGLHQNLSQLREENIKLETLLFDREAEVKSIKEKIAGSQSHRHQHSLPKDLNIDHESVWSKVKIVKRKPRETREAPTPTSTTRMSREEEMEKQEENASQDTIVKAEAPEDEIAVEKEVEMDPGNVTEQCAGTIEVQVLEKLASIRSCSIKKETHPWKMDLHALGVSYKIKRLQQQLLMLEKLAAMQRSSEKTVKEDNEPPRVKTFLLLMPLVNKQVSRYQILEENIDNLCKHMHANNLKLGDPSIAKTKKEKKKLEHFLEETFQIQRYMVATGQKLTDIQSKFASDYICGAEDAEKSAGFDMKRFANGISTLFKEVQRGLEIRIARIIGDLEGTLASEGISHSKSSIKFITTPISDVSK